MPPMMGIGFMPRVTVTNISDADWISYYRNDFVEDVLFGIDRNVR